ncbi:MAG: hypothetical protein JSR46_05410 [Verrucomicrobia bacterium]|nr:hypothetical protein [Verrucomicrobiota bacterium]
MVQSTNFNQLDLFSTYSPMQVIESSINKNFSNNKVVRTILRINLNMKLPEKSLSSDIIKISPQNETIPMDEINVLTQEELNDCLDNARDPASADRFQRLLKAFTYIPHEQPYRALWVQLPDDSYMYLTVEESTYYSQCFKEEDQHPGRNCPTNQSYYYVNAYTHNNRKKLYFQIRLNKECSNAEIVHIQSGGKITGTEVKGICMRVLNYIRPEICVLYDDSKIVNKDKKKYMRLYMPIVSESPKTWYSGENFQVCNIDQNRSLQFKGKEIPCQEFERYSWAVETIRCTKMATIFVHENRKVPKRFLPYLTDEQKQNFNNITVHDVGKAIFQKLKEVNFAEKSKASHDFSFFYDKYVATTDIYHIPQHYCEALHVLDSSKIWIQLNNPLRS